MEIIKFAEFYAMEIFVASVGVVVVIAALYQFVCNKVSEHLGAPTDTHKVHR